MKWIVYTDLDGTLLDFKTYSYERSLSTVKKLIANKIPLVFCSSKTRLEQQVFRENLGVSDPFIVENGSAILIPPSFFEFDLSSLDFLQPYQLGQLDDYQVIVLGDTHFNIREVIENARKESGLKVEGYSDLSLEEIMSLTTLDASASQRAASRDFSETLLKGVDETSSAYAEFTTLLESHQLQCVSGGKFHTVMGKGSDKGVAVQVLNQLFALKYDQIQTIGLGDSANDLPLLDAVDYPFLVQKPNGSWQHISNEKVNKIDGIGPEGWNIAIHSLLKI